jgi:hypothetical protein
VSLNIVKEKTKMPRGVGEMVQYLVFVLGIP